MALLLLIGCHSAPLPTPPSLAEKGKALAKEQKITEAVKTFNQGIAREPDRPDAYIGLAVLYESVGRPDLAVETLEQLQAAAPDAPGLHCRLAEAALGTEDLLLARSEGEKAVQEGTDLVRAHSVYGITLVRFRSWESAAVQLTKAIELLPDDIEVPLVLMEVYLQQGAYDKAIALGEKYVTRFPQSARLHYRLGLSYTKVPGKTEQAIAQLRAAIEVEPGWFEPYAELGRTYKTTGRRDEALTAFERAWELNPGVAGVAFNLADLYRQKKDPRATKHEAIYQRLMKEQEHFTALRRDTNQDADTPTTLTLAEQEGKLKRFGTALYRLRRVLQKEPTNRKALLLAIQLDRQARVGFPDYLRPGPGIGSTLEEDAALSTNQ
ncbi:tetratricopeptide repeat protein [Armatimonas sp.]|uniref:tetratricopeptide repeat protein n=1 Tax=Armatimonas sp. TaxID=1872638 RepID=UPI00286B0B0C|nr:tetratricopeptide repeat protein [Armatimonas sp.]